MAIDRAAGPRHPVGAVDHALVTAWDDDGAPCLAAVSMRAAGVRVTAEGWQAVGMSATRSVDVLFDAVNVDTSENITATTGANGNVTIQVPAGTWELSGQPGDFMEATFIFC